MPEYIRVGGCRIICSPFISTVRTWCPPTRVGSEATSTDVTLAGRMRNKLDRAEAAMTVGSGIGVAFAQRREHAAISNHDLPHRESTVGRFERLAILVPGTAFNEAPDAIQ